MSSFSRLARVTASTKRAVISGGKKGAPATLISSLVCSPLDPASAEIEQRFQVKTPYSLLQTFVDGALDIQEGDLLAVGGKDYPVRSVAEWTWHGSRYLHLVIEDLKR